MNLIKNFAKIISRLDPKNSFKFGRYLNYIGNHDILHNDILHNGESNLVSSVMEYFKFLKETDSKICFFDVGANVGDYTSMIINQAKSKNMLSSIDIHIFEPVHSTLCEFKNNLGNSISYINQLNDFGLSSRDGKLEIFVEKNASGTNSVHKNDFDNAIVTPETISLLTADTYCKKNNIHHVHFLKCDTEGHDYDVLLGAIELLENSRITCIQFEYNHRWIYSRNFLYNVFILIKNLPYKIAKINENQLIVFNSWHPEMEKFVENNYLIFHNNMESVFNCKSVEYDSSNCLTFKKN